MTLSVVDEVLVLPVSVTDPLFVFVFGEVLSKGTKPLSLFVGTDTVTLGAEGARRKNQYKIPMVIASGNIIIMERRRFILKINVL